MITNLFKHLKLQHLFNCIIMITTHQQTNTHYDVPLNSVDPPERTIFENSVRLRSISDFLIAYVSTSWIPSHSSPIRSGRNRSSGARNRAKPTCHMTQIVRVHSRRQHFEKNYRKIKSIKNKRFTSTNYYKIIWLKSMVTWKLCFKNIQEHLWTCMNNAVHYLFNMGNIQ